MHRATQGAGDVGAVPPAVRAVAAIRVEAGPRPAPEVGVRVPDAGVEDIGRDALAGAWILEAPVESCRTLVDPVEAPRRSGLEAPIGFRQHPVGVNTDDPCVPEEPRPRSLADAAGEAVQCQRVGVRRRNAVLPRYVGGIGLWC